MIDTEGLARWERIREQDARRDRLSLAFAVILVIAAAFATSGYRPRATGDKAKEIEPDEKKVERKGIVVEWVKPRIESAPPRPSHPGPSGVRPPVTRPRPDVAPAPPDPGPDLSRKQSGCAPIRGLAPAVRARLTAACQTSDARRCDDAARELGFSPSHVRRCLSRVARTATKPDRVESAGGLDDGAAPVAFRADNAEDAAPTGGGRPAVGGAPHGGPATMLDDGAEPIVSIENHGGATVRAADERVYGGRSEATMRGGE